jgi:hypothetical protein
MNLAPVEKIVQALLYERYMLYPYRPSALKNRVRFPFGSLYPQSWRLACENTDAWKMQTECLVQGIPETVVEVRVRFLQLITGVAEKAVPTWNETGEREVSARATIGELMVQPKRAVFISSPARPGGMLSALRDHADAKPTACHPAPASRHGAVEGCVELSAEEVGESVFKATVRIENLTPFDDAAARSHDEALHHALLSTHTILALTNGEFISLLDPLPQFRDLVATCRNIGTWPVLVGDAGSRDMMLSSPIILYDYPQIAPESPGDLFDGTEIDELLTLRLSTLADAEEQEIVATDGRARALLDRTKSLTREQLLNLHGSMRGRSTPNLDKSIASCAVQDVNSRLTHIRIGTVDVRPGTRVRLSPRRGADVFDLVLAGKLATVQSIEQDYEGRVYVAVTVDDDPGNDLGAQAQPGHRFFFGPEELEPIANEEGRI